MGIKREIELSVKYITVQYMYIVMVFVSFDLTSIMLLYGYVVVVPGHGLLCLDR